MMIASSEKQKGSAFIYILVAIALLAAVTSTFMSSTKQQKTAQDSAKLAIELKSQIDYIYGAIRECVLTYPDGDTGYTGPAVIPYPLAPNRSYLTSPTVDSWAEDIRCPGNPGNSNNHAKIFGGSTGKFMPNTPAGFNKWWYVNGPDGVFMDISTSRQDSYIVAALNKLDDMFSECEADLINGHSGMVVMTTDGESCGNGNYCFRVWLVTKPTAMYQAGSPEATAGCPY